MIRKNLRHYAGLAITPLILPTLALGYSLLTTESNPRVVMGWIENFQFINLGMVIPLFALFTGIVLFTEENWDLVLTFARSRLNIFLSMVLSGFILVALGYAAAVTFFGLLNPSGLSFPDLLRFGLIGAVAFMSGVLAGLGGGRMRNAFLLVLAAGVTLFIPIWLLHWNYLYMEMLRRIGMVLVYVDLITATSLIFMIGCLLSQWIKPVFSWKQATLATGSLIVCCLLIHGMNLLLLQQSTTVSDLDQVQLGSAGIVNEDTIIIYGRNRRLAWLNRLDDWIHGHSTVIHYPVYIGLELNQRRVIPLNIQQMLFSLVPSADGEYVVVLFYGQYPEGNRCRIRLYDRHLIQLAEWGSDDGLVAYSPVWNPETHECCISLKNTILLLDADRRKTRKIGYPSSGGVSSPAPMNAGRQHCFYLARDRLFCVIRHDHPFESLYLYLPDREQWIPVAFDAAPSAELHPADRIRMAASLLAAWSKTLSPTRRPNITYSHSLHQRMTAIGPDWYIPYYQGDRIRFKKMPSEFDSLYTTDYGLLGLEKNRIRLESWADDSTLYDRIFPYEISRGCVHGHKAFFDIREGQTNKALDSWYGGPEAEINPEELSGLAMKTIILDLVSGEVEKELLFPNRQFPTIFLDANGPLGLWLELVSGNLYLVDLRTEEIREIFP